MKPLYRVGCPRTNQRRNLRSICNGLLVTLLGVICFMTGALPGLWLAAGSFASPGSGPSRPSLTPRHFFSFLRADTAGGNGRAEWGCRRFKLLWVDPVTAAA